MVLITSDFQGVPKVMSDPVFEQLRKKFGLERHQVMLTFSHNHCGPRLGDDLVDYYPVEAEQVKLVDEYTALMVERLVTMVGESSRNSRPRSCGWAREDDVCRESTQQPRDRRSDLLAQHKPLAGPVDHTCRS